MIDNTALGIKDSNPFTREYTLVDVLVARAQAMPERRAYCFLADGEFKETSLTYRELDHRARAIADLIRNHANPGERVLLLYPPGMEFIAGLWGCFYAGVVAVPAYSPARKRHLPKLESIINDCGAIVAITVADSEASLKRIFQDSSACAGLRLLSTDVLDHESRSFTSDVRADALALLQYTSGSTGDPKGVMLRHRNLIHNQQMIKEAFGHTEESLVVGWLPVFHDMGLIGNVLQPVYAGCPAVLMAPIHFLSNPFRWLQAVSRYSATTSGGPNFAYDLCVDKIAPEQRSQLDLTTWALAFNGAEPVRANTIDRFASYFGPCGFNRNAFYPCYGLAEATLLVSGGLKTEAPVFGNIAKPSQQQDSVVETAGLEPSGVLVGCGHSWLDQNITIVDPATLSACGPGEVGEIWVSGASVADGYWNRPEETELTFHATLESHNEISFLRTGDLGLQENGHLFIAGRIKDLIIIRGRNHHPQDIELSAEQSHRCVQPAGGAAFSVEGEGQGQLVLVCELKRECRRADFDEIFKSIRAAVAEDMQIRVDTIVLIREGHLPKTTSGKVQRYLCRRLFLSHELPSIASSERFKTDEDDASDCTPRSDEKIQGRVAEIWRDVLRADSIGLHDTFFELGGDSLAAIQIISRLRDRFKRDLSIETIFEAATIARLAKLLESPTHANRDIEIASVARTASNQKLPLSFAQQELFLQDELQPDDPAYSINIWLQLKGIVAVPALEACLSEVLRRHEALRTISPSSDADPVQVICPARRHLISIKDLRTLARSERVLEDLIREEANRPLNLSRGPLLRSTLLYLGEREHALLLSLHHIASDAWSMRILVNEIETLYPAFLAGSASSLPELPLQYSDFCIWQHQWLRDKVLEEDLLYWKSRLFGLERLRLPADRPRSAASENRVATRRRLIPLDIKEALKSLALQERATLFMTMLSGFVLLLGRYTEQDDIGVSTPIAIRSQAGTESLIGLFVNTLVIRIDLSPGDSFRELLARARKVCLGAYAHRHAPFMKILECLRPYRDGEAIPYREVKCTLESGETRMLQLPQLDTSVAIIEAGTAKAELALDLLETRCGLEASASYNTDRFDATTIDRILNNLSTLLEAIVESPDRSFFDLSVLSNSESHQLLVEFNDTSADYETDKCVHEIFAEHAIGTPDKIAVMFEGRALSYGDLDQRANRLARYLGSIGVSTGSMVAVFLDRSEEMVIGILAVMKAGAGFVPLDPSYPNERLAFMLEDAHLEVTMTDEGLSDLLPASRSIVVSVDGDLDQVEQQNSELPPASLDPTNLVYSIYTSGSTGQPKAVAVEHRSLTNLILGGIKEFGLGPDDVIPCTASFSFDISMFELFTPLALGGTLIVASTAEKLDPHRLTNIFEESTWSTTVPSVMRMIIDTLSESGRPGSNRLRTICVGGEAVPASLLVAIKKCFPAARLRVLYGPTETTVLSTSFRVGEQIEPTKHMLGKPLPNTIVRIYDGNEQLVPIGVPGQIYIGGAGVSQGYLYREELTHEKFVRIAKERLYKTGDVGRWLTDGNIEFLGRRDLQFKIKGYRIEPGEIETQIIAFQGVKEAVVVARDEQGGQKKLVAYVVMQEPSELPEARLREHLRRQLPAFMLPDAVVQMERLPLNVNGKIDPNALPPPGSTRLSGTAVAPRTGTEAILASIWREVLGLDSIGIQDNFFEAGGDSITAIQITFVAKKQGLSITASEILRHQTIAALASVTGIADTASCLPGEAKGQIHLTPIQRWFFEQEFSDPHHWNMGLLLELREPIKPALLIRAIEILVTSHGGFHTRFHRTDLGWVQRNEEPTLDNTIVTIDLSAAQDDRHSELIDAIARDAQRSLDLKYGPLARFALLDFGKDRPCRLLIVIHHLVVDGLSWRILLEDLESGYMHLARQQPLDLPPKSASFKEWVEALNDHARKAMDLREEFDFWLSQVTDQSDPLRTDFAADSNIEELAAVVTASLNESQTRSLLALAPAIYGSGAYELLLAALVKTLTEWTGQNSLVIGLEGHGREELGRQTDISRTMGWFTTLYPVHFRIEEGASPIQVLKSVKEQVRRVPHRGIGYGLLRYLCEDLEIASRLRALPFPEVIFNYLGRLSSNLDTSSVFRRVEQVAHARSGNARRPGLWEINCLVIGSQLKVEWRYGSQIHSQQTIERLVQAFVDSIRWFISQPTASGSIICIPSDFPLSKLGRKELYHLAGKRSALEDIYPLSSTQLGILYHCIRDPEPAVYLQQLRIQIEGDLDPDSLHRAWSRVVERHDALRTSFEWQRLNDPVQVVERKVELQWLSLDLRDLSEEDQRSGFEAVLGEDRNRGFDLTRAPLMRFYLIRLSDRIYRLIWSRHHLAFDGWSLAVVLDEAIQFYNALNRGLELSLGDPRRYRDYIEWLMKRDLSQSEVYWRKKLGGSSVSTVIQTGRAGGPREAGVARIRCSRTMTIDLADYARARRFTINTLIQGAWAILLSRYSGQEDVIYGTAMSGRPSEVPCSTEMVGLFINTLPVRTTVSQAAPVGPWLQDLQDQLATMHDHECTPLVKVHAWSGIPRGSSLFEYIIVFENFPLQPSLSQGARNSCLNITVNPEYESTNYPLALFCSIDKEFELRLCFDRGLFNETFAQRTLEHLRVLLMGLISGRDAVLASLSLLTEAEIHQVIMEWNDTASEHSGQACIHRFFEEQVARSPDAIALASGVNHLTYRRLNSQANQLALYLRGSGVREEVVAGICMNRSCDMVVGLLAILKAGGAYLPLDPAYPEERLALMVADSGARILLTQRELLGRFPEGTATITLTEEAYDGFAELQLDNSKWASEPQNLCYLIYTSGSTGRPKGVQVTHGAVINLLTSIAIDMGLSNEDVILSTTGLSFDISALEIFLPLIVGGTLVLVSREVALDGIQLAAELIRAAPSVMQATPSSWKVLLDGGWSATPRLRVLCGGEALSEDLALRLRERAASVWNLYGPTETTIWSTVGLVNDAPVSLGRPVLNTRIRVMDQCWHLAPAGILGEICIGGTGLSRGYLNAPELTAVRYIPDPFCEQPGSRIYQTGDYGRLTGDGTIQFIGRADQQAKVRGYRIELGEVESYLLDHPSVRDAVAVSVLDVDGNNTLVAYVVPRAEQHGGARPESLDFSLFYLGDTSLSSEDNSRFCLQAAGFADQHEFLAVWMARSVSCGSEPSLSLREDLESSVNPIKVRAFVGTFSAGTPATVTEELAGIDSIWEGKGRGCFTPGCLPRDILVSSNGLFKEKETMLVAAEGAQDSCWELQVVAADKRQDRPEAMLSGYLFPSESPVWVNCGGDRSRFLKAGEIGANVATSLFVQTIDQAARNIAVYRQCLAINGHDPEARCVTMIMPTFVGETDEEAIEKARGPLVNFMNSHPRMISALMTGLSVGVDSELQRGIKDLDSFAFEYYRRSASLVGSVDTCRSMVERMTRIGVDEIACLIDFGVDSDSLKAGLPHLIELRERSAKPITLDAGGLRDYLKGKIPQYMIPSSFIILDSLPRTANGKVDRKRLSLFEPPAPRPEINFVAPRTQTERVLADIWAGVLNLQRVGVNNSFFDLGGHSLLAIKIISRVRESFSVDIPLQRLFELPTIAGMATEIDSSIEKGLIESLPAIEPAAREIRRIKRPT